MKPTVLNEDSLPMAVTQWENQMRAYMDASHVQEAERETQLQFLYGTLDSALQMLVESSLEAEVNPTLEVAIEHTKGVFVQKYPLFARRLKLFMHKQKQGEDTFHYLAALKKEKTESSLDTMTHVELWVMLMIAGISDVPLRKELLKLDDPNEAQVFEEIRKFHTVATNQKEISGDAARVTGNRGRGRGNRGNRGNDFRGRGRG
jgi:ABC-type Zn2+ transport system substrate-binding protein/surface adhesin